MITSVAWVRRGAAARLPRTEGSLDEGLETSVPPKAMKKKKKEKASAAASSSEADDGKAAGKRRAPEADGPGAGDDDSDDSDSDDEGLKALTTGNLMFYGSNKEDPNLKALPEDDLDSEMEDYEIGDTDLLLLGTRSDEQVSNLEAYVYEEPQDNLYPHHDVPLPVFPLCVAWFDFQAAAGPDGSEGCGPGRGNFAAVGTFAPYIEVWDLDVMDGLEPFCVLGGAAAAALADEQFTSHAAEALAASERQKHGNPSRAEREGGKKGKKKKTLGGRSGEYPQGHTDAVMCLAWNPLQPNCLASGSADSTVRLWDLEGDCGGSLSALTHHKDKVQALAWHPSEAPALLTAGFDRRVCAVDVRAPTAIREWSLTADAERVCWSPGGTSFVVSTEDGIVNCFDVRAGAATKPLWSLQAHKEACTGLSFCPAAPSILATCGQDKLAKLWSIADGDESKPALVSKRNLQLGGLFDISFCPDSPALLAAGGSKGKLGIWNTLEVDEMQALMPTAEAPLGDDGRVLSGAVAGMGALEVNSSDDEDDATMPAMAAPTAGGRAVTSQDVEEEEEQEEKGEDEDEDEDEEDEDNDDEEVKVVEEGDGGRAAVAARVAAAAAAASRTARRSKAKVKVKRSHK